MRVIEPLEDRVLVKPEPIAQTSASGLIIIPPSVQGTLEKLRRAKVILVGAEVKRLLVDDLVMYGEFTGTPVEHEGQDHLMMREADVICVYGVDKANTNTDKLPHLIDTDLREPGNGC